MNRQNIAMLAILVPSLFLASCGAKEIGQSAVLVSGAKSAVSMMHMLSQKILKQTRPSAPIGIYTGLYISQGIILPVHTAYNGIISIGKIIEGQLQTDTDENFAVLREIGDVLQINIIDLLNRSTDRAEALNNYTQSLRNVGILTERKINEITANKDRLTILRKEQQKTARDINRSLTTAMRDQDYGEASDLQEQLSKANAILAETETEEDQAKDMINRMEDLYDITGDRLQAIESNRGILIAGLRVINVPGIADFNILEKGKSWKKRGTEDIFGTTR